MRRATLKEKGDEAGCQRPASRFGLHPGDLSGFSFQQGGREELSGDKHEAGRADSAGSLSFDEDRALIKVRQPC